MLSNGTSSQTECSMKVYRCQVCGELYFEEKEGPLTPDYFCRECGASYESFVDITNEYNNSN